MVNGGEPVVGSSPGKLTGLDLVDALYLGGVPDFAQLPVEAGYTSGLRGCISRLIVDDNHNYDFIREAREKVNTALVYHSCTTFSLNHLCILLLSMLTISFLLQYAFLVQTDKV